MGSRRQKLFAPLERDIQAACLDHWKLLGLPDTLVAAIPNANPHGMAGLTPGLPDLLVMGPRVPGRMALVELKRDAHAPLSAAQKDIRDLCGRLRVAWRCTQGRDEPIELLELWGVVARRASEDARLSTGFGSRGVERQGQALPARGEAGVAEESERHV